MHIAIAGNIGSGKTTLTTLLSKHFKWKAHYEDVENNPYLNDFYKEMQRWAFNLQDSYGESNKFWLAINWSKASDSLVLRDVPGDITSIGNQREQNLKQNVSLNGVVGDLRIKVEHQGSQTLNPILTNGYKKIPSLEFKYFKNFKNFTIYERLHLSYFKADNIHGFYGYQNENNKFIYVNNQESLFCRRMLLVCRRVF